MSDETAPERIWLQTAGCYEETYSAMAGTDTGVTWCEVQQDGDDTEYVRADIAAARIEALEAALKSAASKADWFAEVEFERPGKARWNAAEVATEIRAVARTIAADIRAALGEGEG